MKNKKTYRSNSVKALWILIAHIAAVAVAVCTVLLVAMYDEGIVLWDENKSYEQSQRFMEHFSYTGQEIISNLSKDINYEKLKKADPTEVIDLEVFRDNGYGEYVLQSASAQSVSGLAYSVEDLLNWSKEWAGRTTGNNVSDPIIQCIKQNGDIKYFYYDEFRDLVLSGEIELDYTDYVYDDQQALQDRTTDINNKLEQLSNGYDIGSARDTKTGEAYNSVYASPIVPIEEKYAPVDAENLLEVLNTNSKWNGRLEEAYDILETLLSTLNYYVDQDNNYLAEEYSEGNTNFSYLFADTEERKVYTNREAYKLYVELDNSIEDMKENGTYAVVSSNEADSMTDIGYVEKEAILPLWNHTIKDQLGLDDFVFVLQVDSTFPIADEIAAEAINYEMYRSDVLPVAFGEIGAVLVLLVSMAYLTVTAGRKPGDEEIHLNSFDHWPTEIGAIVILGIWVGVLLFFGSILNQRMLSNINGILGVAGFITLITMILFMVGYLSLVRRIKARFLWKNSLLRRIFHGLGKGLKKGKEFLSLYAENTASKVKTTILLIAFLGMQFLFCAIIFSGGVLFLLLLAFLDLLALIYVVRRAGGWDIILDGLKRISQGELNYKIPLDKLEGEQKTMAEYINNIGSGLDAAVEKSVKNERMKTELITNVSHDLKTPLTSIINYVDLLKRENFTDEKITGYLDILDEKSQRLKVLTEDVVEASKASSGNITLEMTEIDFVEMIQQVIGEFEERFQEKNLVMMVHFPDEPSMIYADGQRMWRVLENIFGNVIKYAMEGTRVYAEIINANKKVTFSMKNISAQPLNISPDELTERFIRGDISRNTEGSGLGLSIAKSLTELQNGEFKIYVDGDLFKVTITFTAKTKGSEKI